VVPYPRPLPDEPLALDLLNTELVVGGEPLDLLATRDGVAHWLELHGFTGRPGPKVHDHLTVARAAIRAVLEADPGGRARLNAVLDHARVRRQLGPDGPEQALEVDEPSWLPAVTAAADLLDLLTDRRERIRQCGHPRCVLWFLDTSKGGARRWHDMATCGNRTKAERHARKERTGRR